MKSSGGKGSCGKDEGKKGCAGAVEGAAELKKRVDPLSFFEKGKPGGRRRGRGKNPEKRKERFKWGLNVWRDERFKRRGAPATRRGRSRRKGKEKDFLRGKRRKGRLSTSRLPYRNGHPKESSNAEKVAKEEEILLIRMNARTSGKGSNNQRGSVFCKRQSEKKGAKINGERRQQTKRGPKRRKDHSQLRLNTQNRPWERGGEKLRQRKTVDGQVVLKESSFNQGKN